MFRGFHDYWQTRKPVVDAAFTKTLCGLLEGITLTDDTLLRDSLKSGKMIRGGLTCMINEALGGILDAAVPRAISIEMIQAATLIHDDFIDGHTSRRGRPSTWTIEGARRAVLVGDVIFAFAIKMMSDLGKEDGALVSHAIAQVSRGALHEGLDPLAFAREIESGRVDKRLYEKIIYLKTAILFGTACLLGAIAAKADLKLQEVFYRYGLRIGEAYQIADDLQEVKAHFAKGTINPDQMAALTPLFLQFTNAMRPFAITLLRGEVAHLDGEGLGFFRDVQELMEEEIESRLRLAMYEVEENLRDNSYTELLRQAPRDIIEMFNVRERISDFSGTDNS